MLRIVEAALLVFAVVVAAEVRVAVVVVVVVVVVVERGLLATVHSLAMVDQTDEVALVVPAAASEAAAAVVVVVAEAAVAEKVEVGAFAAGELILSYVSLGSVAESAARVLVVVLAAVRCQPMIAG